MKIKWGGVIQDVRGSVGGITFRRGPYGPVGSRRAGPRQPLTEARAFYREGVRENTARWAQNLTEGQRDAWRRLVAGLPVVGGVADTVVLNALMLYLRVNQIRRAVGLLPLDTPPPDQVITALETLALNATAVPSVVVSFAPSPLPPDHRLYILASPPLRPGIRNVSRDLALVDVSPLGQASPYDFTPQYTDRYTAPRKGQAVTVSVSTVRDSRGHVSPPLMARSFIPLVVGGEYGDSEYGVAQYGGP